MVIRMTDRADGRLGRHREQHLIFDADDTLWENNRVFEEVIADFVEWLEHPELDAAGVREVLDEIEHANIAVHGYGTRAFTTNLTETYRRIGSGTLGDEELELEVARLVRRLRWERLELIADVEATLEALAARHDLLLLTKGDEAEQGHKIEISGLASHFRQARIVPEKDEDAYRQLVLELELPVERTWMIGNSPRSDILAPLAAGLRSVYLPHPATWSLEHAEIPGEHARVLQLERFDELLNHF